MKQSLDFFKRRFEDGENPTRLMTEMEESFQIPMLNNEEWNAKNLDIIELYRKISASRF